MVEMLIVIAILAILIGLAVLAFGPRLAASKTSPGCASNLRQLAMVYVMYEGDNDGRFPTFSLTQQTAKPDSYSTAATRVDQCPLTKNRYWDNVGRALAANNSIAYQTSFPDGSPIPTVNFERDVLYRCLDHGYAGFTRGSPPGQGRTEGPTTTGTTLGVRLDTSVAKVAPHSCWEFRYQPSWAWKNLPNLWKACD